MLTSLRFIFKNYEDHILRKFQYTIQSDLLNLYIEKLFNDVNVSLSDYFYKLNTEGDRLSRVGFGFGKIGFHLLQIIVFLAFLLYENYLIFLVFILLLISSIPFARLIKKIQSQKSNEHSQDIKNINDLGEKYVSNYFFIKSLNKESHELSNFKKITQDLKKNLVRLNILASVSYHLPTTVAFMSVSLLIILFSDLNVSEQSLSLIVILRTLTSVGSMLVSVSELNNFSSFVKNYVDSVSEKYSKSNSIIETTESHDLIIENTDFNYSNEEIFKNLSIKIGFGEKLLITGPNGSGKSTLVGILMGIFIPQEGNLKIKYKI